MVYPSSTSGNNGIDINGTAGVSITNSSITYNQTTYTITINSDNIVFKSSSNYQYIFANNTNYVCPTFTGDGFIAPGHPYTCTATSANDNNVKGFSVHQTTVTNPTPTACATICNSLDNCVGFAIASDNSQCLFKAVDNTAYNDTGDSHNYFFCSNVSNINRSFIIFNKQTNSVLCIDDNVPSDRRSYNWYIDWGSNESDGGRFINFRSITKPSNPIPAKAVFRYENSDKTFRSTASNAFMYISKNNNGRVKIGYGDPSTNTDVDQYQFYYDTDTGSTSNKSIKSINGSKYITCSASTCSECVTGTSVYSTVGNSKFEILFLPQFPISMTLPTTQMEPFFIIAIDLPDGTYYVTCETSSKTYPYDGNQVSLTKSNPYKSGGATMWCSLTKSNTQDHPWNPPGGALCSRMQPTTYIQGHGDSDAVLSTCSFKMATMNGGNNNGLQTDLFQTSFIFDSGHLTAYLQGNGRSGGTGTIHTTYYVTYDPGTNNLIGYRPSSSIPPSTNFYLIPITTETSDLKNYTSGLF